MKRRCKLEIKTGMGQNYCPVKKNSWKRRGWLCFNRRGWCQIAPLILVSNLTGGYSSVNTGRKLKQVAIIGGDGQIVNTKRNWPSSILSIDLEKAHMC